MPGYLVFPGGRVDDGDHVAAVAAGLRPEVAALLTGHGSSGRVGDLPRALAVAAARELFEETGLTLGCPDMSEVFHPDLSSLRYLGRAVTPSWSPVRFDARFFAAPACAAQGEVRDSAELEDVGWYPADVTGATVAPITARVLSAFRDAMMLLAQGGWPPPACFTVPS
ncbi:NUDIX domain-containing protein [Roseomonas elaeocarpi]|uniref:NUDIX domain-containing protein n=1 Tax=Roseomonas elaeocarpi TaxID=907779 RepID=A0ABV6JUM7_9PROT